MRNLRILSKHGGVEIEVEKICIPRSTSASCIKSFLEEKGFLRIKTPTDGNCFYHTLTKFLKLSQDPSLPDSHHRILRNIVVDKMVDNISEISPYFIENNTSVYEQIEGLKDDGVWDSDAGDIVSQYAAKALNMRIKIYDVKAPQKVKRLVLARSDETGKEVYRNIAAQPMKIVSYTFDPEMNTGVIIHMLRVSDGHYELLYPEEAGVMPPSRRRTVKKTTNRIISKSPKSRSITRKKSANNNKPTKVYQTRSKKLEQRNNNELTEKMIQLAIAKETEEE